MARASAQISPEYLKRHGIEAPKPTRASSPQAGQKAEAALYGWLDILKIPYVPQYEWGKLLTPPRKFQSDAAILSARLLVEIDGRVHGVQDKRERDLERQNLGIKAGYLFLRYTPEQAISGEASLDIQKFLEGR